MTDKPYSYPKSSCLCNYCPDVNVAGYYKPFDDKTAVPTNMSIDNCQVDKLSNCFDTRYVKYDIEPQLLKEDNITKFTPENSEITVLNDKNLTISIDCNDALTRNCECNEFNGMCFVNGEAKPHISKSDCIKKTEDEDIEWKCNNWGCTGNVYIRDDPRPMNYATKQALPLNRPPFNGSLPLQMSEIYNPELDKVGKPAKNYSDLYGGDITYYVDEQFTKSLYEPLFTIRSNTSKELYIDPMGSKKPHYGREPLTVNHRNISDYSFDRDQMAFREDILQSNMAQMNQRNWSMWWGANKNK
jgi:hypothetical protein